MDGQSQHRSSNLISFGRALLNAISKFGRPGGHSRFIPPWVGEAVGKYPAHLFWEAKVRGWYGAAVLEVAKKKFDIVMKSIRPHQRRHRKCGPVRS